MKLTTKGRYAVTAMLDLCCQNVDTPVSLIDISKRQEISLSYLEQLFAKLRRRGLVRSVRGPGGGYLLVAPAATISVADIIRAVDEPIQATSCDENDPEGCRKSTRCITHHLWERVGGHINSYLESIYLGSLIEEIRAGTLATPGGHGLLT
ncbi:MAG: Rrf2 family transcriptional regulator [Magnetococcales bacterium]|nr:Rrf2 family transcriptional regulator [Magnetococcales bacterium]